MNKAKSKNYWSKDDDKLLHAVERNNLVKVCNLLSKKGLQCAKVHPDKGVSALHVAVREGYAGIVDKFIEQKPFSGINAKDSQGQTVVHYAAKKARYSVLLKLLKCDPDLAAVDVNERGALHHASDGGHINCVQLLIASGAPTNFKDKDGKTPLAYAAEKGQASICRLLIEKGSNVNEVDHANRTPLLLAAIHRHASVCDYLVRKGAKVDVLDLKGHSPMWHAAWNMDKETSRVLAEAANSHSNSSLGKARSFNEREIIEDDHYEQMGTVKTKNKGLISSSSSNLDKETNSCNLVPMFKDEFKVTPLQGKSSSLVHLDQRDVSSFSKQLEKKKDAGEGPEKQTEFSEKISESVSDGKLDMASFRALLDNTFVKKPSLERNKAKGYDSTETENLKSPKESAKASIEKDEATEYVSAPQQAEEASGSSSTFQSHKERHESASNQSLSSKTSETLSGTHFVQLHQQQHQQEQQQQQQHPQDQDTYNSLQDSPPSMKNIQSFEMEQLADSDHEVGKEVCNTFATTTTPPKASKEGEDVVDANNNKISMASCDEKNYILKEKLDLLEKLKLASENRQNLEDEKKELLKKLEMASVSQQWTLHELRCMKMSVEKMLVQLKEMEEEEADRGGEKAAESDMKDFSEDLKGIQSRIGELLQLHEEGLNEENQAMLNTIEVDESSEYKDYLNRKIISLVKEKNLLAYKLKQILEENSAMSGQLKEVEVVIGNAVELKKENELLIKDYENFKKIKEEEMSEVDELVRLFKESLNENETLRGENEKLAGKLEEVKRSTDGVNMEDLKKENLKLMFEKVQLEETVVQQKQNLLEIDEKLEAGTSLEKALDQTDATLIKSEKPGEAANKETVSNEDYKELYEKLKAELLNKEQELEENKELIERIKKAMSEYEDVKGEIEALKLKLEQKNTEIILLNDKTREMNEQLKDSFENYKKSLESIEKRNTEKLTQLRVENDSLTTEVEHLKEDLVHKETSYQLLNSNLNLEKRQKHNLEEFRNNIIDLASKTCDKNDLPLANSKVFEKLKEAIEESAELKNENYKIKNELYEIELRKEMEKEKNKELRGVNEGLQVEIASLKRTISEQGAYLTILSPHDETDSALHKPKIESDIKVTSSTPISSSPKTKGVDKKDVSESTKTIKKQKLEIEKLNNEILVLTSQIECLEQNEKDFRLRSEANVQRKEDEIEDLGIEVSKLNKKCSELEDKNLNMEEVMKEREDKLSNAEDLEKDFERVVTAYYRLSGHEGKRSLERKKTIESMIEWLEAQRKTTKEVNLENETLKQEVQHLKTKIIELENRHKKLMYQSPYKDDESIQNMKPLFFKLRSEYGKLKEIEGEIASINDQKEHLKHELDEVMVNLLEKEKKLEALKKNPSSDVKDLLEADSEVKFSKAEKQKLTRQLDNLYSEVENVEKSLAGKKDKVRKLMEDTKEELAVSIMEFEDLSKEIERDHGETLVANGRLERPWIKPNTETNKLTFDSETSRTTYVESDHKKELLKAQSDLEELMEKYESLEKLCSELKSENSDLEKKYNNVLETNEILSEKYNRSESVLSELEGKEQMINELKETVEKTKEKLERVEEENESLLLQKEKADVMLRIEKLKNLSESVSPCQSPNISIDKQRSVPFSSTPECLESKVDEDFVDDSSYSETNIIMHNGGKDSSTNINGTHKVGIKKCSSDNYLSHNGFDSHTSPQKSYLCPLRIENRRLFLNIIGLQSCLRRKLSLEQTSGSVTAPALNGHATHNGSSDQDNEKIPVDASKGNGVEDFLHALSNKCFEGFSVMVELEEKADSLSTHLQNTDQAKEAFTDLTAKYKAHKDFLQRLQGIMQAVLENHLDVKKALELLPQSLEGFNGITLRSDYVFKTTSTSHSKKTAQSRIRVIRTSGSDNEDKPSTSNEVSSQKLRELQNQLKENERRYREVISSYRRHLLSAVQGDMNPSIKKALLNIVEPHATSPK